MGNGSGDFVTQRRRQSLLIVVREPFPLYRVDLTQLLSVFVARDFDLEWVLPRRDVGLAEVHVRQSERFNLPKRRDGSRSRFSNAFHILMLQTRLWLRAAAGAWDLIQVRDAAISALMYLGAARLARRPFVYWMSFPMVEGYKYRAVSERGKVSFSRTWARHCYAAVADFILYKVVLPRSTHVFVQSARMKADLIQRGIDASKMTPVPMGVNTSDFNPASIRPSDDARLRGKKVVLYMGSIDPIRRVDLLVAAVTEVKKHHEVLLVILGIGTEENRAGLRNFAKACGVLNHCLFIEQLPLHAALTYVARADVCVSLVPMEPAILIPASITKIVEYAALGRPVIANSHPDHEEVVHASGCGKVVPLDIGALADGIKDVLDDPIVADQARERGPAWVEANRSYSAIAGEVCLKYHEIIRSAGSPAR